MKFIDYLNKAHINYINIAIYQIDDTTYQLSIENILSGKKLATKIVDREQLSQLRSNNPYNTASICLENIQDVYGEE